MRFISQKQAAAILGLKYKELQALHEFGVGPPFIHSMGWVFYIKEEVEEFAKHERTWISELEACKMLGVAPNLFRHWIFLGKPVPKYIQGTTSRVRLFDKQSVLEWNEIQLNRTEKRGRPRKGVQNAKQ